MRYEYRCSCGNTFDIVVSLDSIGVVDIECPVCGNKKVERKFNIPTISFKGRGFYSTDNKPIKTFKRPDKENS